ncbi:hypothetical protein P3TCK_10218 [Photobacterium profundum 3TCK]|uniref:Uncharacterized protein n=1 Tax=Photobacterium profundum 3TCK TaxID=314280 RepID=Q1YWI3_9GAMM|nr:hypothetical protein P3TCK_10218 [Photobacterium profundum 3TCK]
MILKVSDYSIAMLFDFNVEVQGQSDSFLSLTHIKLIHIIVNRRFVDEVL